MNEIENLFILLRTDINWDICGLEPVIAINDGEQFIKCYQCEDWIMYDVYDVDPRDEHDEDIEPVDGWCLVNTEEDLDIDFYGILSKLEFIGKAHLPVEVTPLYATCRYVDGSGGIIADQMFHLSLDYQNDQLKKMIAHEMSYHESSDMITEFLKTQDFSTAVEVDWDSQEHLSYGKNSDWWIYFYYYDGDCNYFHFQVFKVEPTTYLDLHY